MNPASRYTSTSRVTRVNWVKHSAIPTVDKRIVITEYTGRFTRSAIRDIVNKKNEYMADLGIRGKFAINLLYPDHWFAGRIRDTDEPADLPSRRDYDHPDGDPLIHKKFTIAYIPDDPRAGGNDPFNDCLFNCLDGEVEQFPYRGKPEIFKQYLGINRNDPVPVSCLEKAELTLGRYKIRLSGDHTYTSTKKARYEIKLKLIDGHYIVDNSDAIRQYPKKPTGDKELPIWFYRDHDDKHFKVYNGKGYQTMSMITFFRNSAVVHQLRQSKYKDESGKIVTRSLKESYDYFIDYADKYKKLTNGAINFYKTGTIYRTALDYFFSCCGHLVIPDPIEQDEAEWIKNASVGSIIYADNGYCGEYWAYDIISSYPSIMSDSRMKIPIKRGEFTRITSKEFNDAEYLTVGIYRFNITTPNDKRAILMRFNKNNYYTHTDFLFAKKLGLSMELIEDDKPNALIYSADKTCKAHELFGEYMDTMFKLKKAKVPESKTIINILWGALCAVKGEDKRVNMNKNIVVKAPENSKITSICPVDGKPWTQNIRFDRIDVSFETDYARLKPFILAKGRSNIANIMLPHLDSVIRCHTDSMVLKHDLKVKTGNKMGDLKFEKYVKRGRIKNMAKIVDIQ